MKVNEIFYSLQGEGLYSEEPSVFVRLAGCNLLVKCSFCDTSYAWDTLDGKNMTPEAIADKVASYPIGYNTWVCITGGEPLFQEEELGNLVLKLKKFGYRVEIETNGTLPLPFWWTRADSWVADIKCPSTGLPEISLTNDWFKTRSQDQVKFVVGTKKDLDFAERVIRRYKTSNPLVMLSPVMDPKWFSEEGGFKIPKKAQLWWQTVAEKCLDLQVQMSLQKYKFIWGNKKGV